MNDASQTEILVQYTIDVVAAFVGQNTISADEVPALIAATHGAIAGLGNEPAAVPEEAGQTFTPAVTARKSLSSGDHIISMIDGKPYKALRRHLSANGLTPEQYRERYNLPAAYPMVAPSYSEARRDMAKKIGLGRKPKDAAAKSEGATPARRVLRISSGKSADAAGAEPKNIRQPRKSVAAARAAAQKHLSGE